MRRILAAALAHNATVQGRTIAFTLPDRITLKAAVGGQGLIEKVEAAYPPSQADAFNPPSPGTPPPGPPSPDTVNLVDNIRRLHLAVDRALPLHGYILPMADLHRAAGHSH
jgi:hypothetical protein